MSELRSERVIQGGERPEQGRSFVVAVVVVLGFLLAAIVGLASADSPWLPGDGSRSSAPAIVGDLLAVALAAGLCVLVALLWIHTPRPTRAKPKASSAITNEEIGTSVRAGSLVLVGGIVVVAFLGIAFWFLLGNGNMTQVPPPVTTKTAAADVVPRPPDASTPITPVFHWFILALVASIAVVVPLGLVARHRLRVTSPEPGPDDPPDSVVRALGETIDQIERETDARQAIIRAYAQMEHAFDGAGIPRRPYEAPFEYVGRALRGLRVSPSAAGRLAALFERARFGQHAIGAETKNEAVGTLREIERQMNEPST